MTEKQVTIRTIIEELRDAVENPAQIYQPSWWLKKASDLSILRSDLTNEITRAEIVFATKVEEFEKLDISHARANNKAKIWKDEKGNSPYEMLQYLRGRLQTVDEFIRISKERSRLDRWES